ncbi:L,D-transpeptidase family protein [Paludibaculum fermentans]|uniref:L,D-transpeptidase family protein n=1 Tax=Paludibaculum fermentans TaxID=1473598 RepID=A0A7S7NS66_PALFE|nr:L,D-transpeptidase family protein [Paludibaculum fermentans]QOY88768.1 L,D-transpeptidase family protein [Paludibaculum fermentans]
MRFRLLFVGFLIALIGWTAAPANTRLADKLVVNKSKRELLLYKGQTVIRTYRVALGRDPVGPKRREGDGKTPEGTYTISAKYAQSAYHMALHISYPSPVDRERARREGVAPGGDILIHGLPNGRGWLGAAHRWMDWTQGCVAVTNEEMEEIWRLVAVGTPIQINP